MIPGEIVSLCRGVHHRRVRTGGDPEGISHTASFKRSVALVRTARSRSPVITSMPAAAERPDDRRRPVAKFFEQSELARRYQAHRPRVHERVIEELVATRPARALDAALDVACGTGHSTAALTAHAPAVYGCDCSSAMLSFAEVEVAAARFVCCQAEALPFSASTFDLVTVGLALHWFDQAKFLVELGRVLAPAGELWVYNFIFPGILFGDESFRRWHLERYLSRYPVPPRPAGTVASLLENQPSRLAPVEERRFDYEVAFTADELRSYLTTSTNIDAALQGGESLQDVDAWLDEELRPFFRERRIHRFAYIGKAEIAAVI
jgi:ubiquinone/menaquinone biosynthesis C-methylase UbiE